MYGRDLLREGLVWRIGDGSKINIHHDNWIPRSGYLRPLGQQYVHGVTKVADLLDAEGNDWDSAKVESMFTESDAADTKKIAVGGPGTDDSLHGTLRRPGFSVLDRLTICGCRCRVLGQDGPNLRVMWIDTKGIWLFGIRMHQARQKFICGELFEMV